MATAAVMGRMAAKYGGSHKPMRNFFDLDASAQSKQLVTGDWWWNFHADPGTQVLMQSWSLAGIGSTLALLAGVAGLCFAERFASHVARRCSGRSPRHRAAMHALKMVRSPPPLPVTVVLPRPPEPVARVW